MWRTVSATIRTVVLVPLFFLLTLLLAVRVILLARRDPTDGRIDATIRWWSRRFLSMAPLRYHVEGADRLDPEERYVIVANHLSTFDIPLLFVTLPPRIRFLAKKELYRIPLVGRAMDAIGIVEIDRERARSAHEAINTASREVVRRGFSLIVFPEGSRSRDGRMRPFKKGAFRIAIDLGLPIVPVVIRGTRESWAPGAKVFSPGRAEVRVLEPVATDRLVAADARRLVEEVHERMQAVYAALSHQS